MLCTSSGMRRSGAFVPMLVSAARPPRDDGARRAKSRAGLAGRERRARSAGRREGQAKSGRSGHKKEKFYLSSSKFYPRYLTGAPRRRTIKEKTEALF